MSEEIKSTGKFALVHRVLTENGEKTDVIRGRVTADINLKKGQTFFFNDFAGDIEALVKNDIVTRSEATERIEVRARLDREYNQNTMYSLRAGKTPEELKAGKDSAGSNTAVSGAKL